MAIRPSLTKVFATGAVAAVACAGLIASAVPVSAGGAAPQFQLSGAARGALTDITPSCTAPAVKGTVIRHGGVQYQVWASAKLGQIPYFIGLSSVGSRERVVVANNHNVWSAVTSHASYANGVATIDATLPNTVGHAAALHITGHMPCSTGPVG